MPRNPGLWRRFLRPTLDRPDPTDRPPGRLPTPAVDDQLHQPSPSPKAASRHPFEPFNQSTPTYPSAVQHVDGDPCIALQGEHDNDTAASSTTGAPTAMSFSEASTKPSPHEQSAAPATTQAKPNSPPASPVGPTLEAPPRDTGSATSAKNNLCSTGRPGGGRRRRRARPAGGESKQCPWRGAPTAARTVAWSSTETLTKPTNWPPSSRRPRGGPPTGNPRPRYGGDDTGKVPRALLLWRGSADNLGTEIIPWGKGKERSSMSGGQLCDEILRMIDDALSDNESTMGGYPAPRPGVDRSADRSARLLPEPCLVPSH